MANTITDTLPAALDDFLMTFAQATGRIGYDDIAALGRAWPSMTKEKQDAVLSVAGRLQEDSSADWDDPAWEDTCEALAEIVKPV